MIRSTQPPGASSASFDRVVTLTLRELAALPASASQRLEDGSVTADCVDDVAVFDSMNRSLRSAETGQR